MVSTVNDHGGRRRLKFANLKSRIRKGQSMIDVIHRVDTEDFLSLPTGKKRSLSQSSCLFTEHLQYYLELNTSRDFQRFGRHILSISRSLPEVLHHLDGIVHLLTAHIKQPWGPAHDHAVLLLAVLAKELEASLFPYFTHITGSLIQSIDTSNPEACARVFQTLAHIFQQLHKPILANPNILKRYYGPLLGHSKDYTRRFAADALASLLRRLGNKALARHVRTILKATACVLKKNGMVGAETIIRKRGSDLVEGLALLIFNICRGIQTQGQLHSKAMPLLRSLLHQQAQEDDVGLPKVQSLVLKQTLRYLCDHVKPTTSGPLWLEILQAVQGVDRRLDAQAGGLCFLKILIEKRGKADLLHQAVQEEVLPSLCNFLAALSSPDSLQLLQRPAQSALIGIVSALVEQLSAQKGRGRQRPAYDDVTSEQRLAAELVEAIKAILAPDNRIEADLSEELATKWFLLRCRGKRSGRTSKDDSLPGDADEDAEQDDEQLRHVVEICVQTVLRSELRRQTWCTILRRLVEGGWLDYVEEGARLGLVEYLLRYIEHGPEQKTNQLMLALRCLPDVLGSVPEGHTLRTRTREMLQRLASDQHTPSTSAMDMMHEHKQIFAEEPFAKQALRNYSAIALVRLARISGAATDPAVLNRLCDILLARIRTHPSSITALRALSLLSPNLPDIASSDLLPFLAPNLRSPSHLLRLSTLRLLTSFPPLSYLPEVTSSSHSKGSSFSPSLQSSNPFTGPCHALSLCLSLETAPLTPTTGWQLGMVLSELTVIAESGCLPRSYLQPLVCYCLGLLHVRYAELWPLASKTLAAVVGACVNAEETGLLWREIVGSLMEIDGRLLGEQGRVKDTCLALLENPERSLHGVEKGIGGETGMLGFCLDEATLNGSEGSEIIRLGVTDPLTAMTQLFGMLKLCPLLLHRKSQDLITLFLTFLRRQYFLVFANDPEAAELNPLLVNEGRGRQKGNHDVGHTMKEGRPTAKAAGAKLLCFLEVLAISGSPKQPNDRNVTERVFICLLSRPIGAIAKAALEALLALKPAHVTPYASTLRALLDDTQLRDALVRFKLNADVRHEHRATFVPILIRLLFGRYLAKATNIRSRTSRNVPSGRRAAIVSFLSEAQSDCELSVFVHLMLRPFLRDPSRPYSEPDNLGLDGVSLDLGRRVGFLHLVQTIIQQMGFRVLAFVKYFMEVTLALLKGAYADDARSNMGDALPSEVTENLEEVPHVEHTSAEREAASCRGTLERSQDPEGLQMGEEEGFEGEHHDSSTTSRGFSGLRTRAIRSLIDLLAQYEGSFDFDPYAGELWSILSPVLPRLPSICFSATQTPALLSFIYTISFHKALLPLYTAIAPTLTPLLLHCLSTARESAPGVIPTILSILEELLHHDGQQYILPYLSLLVQHITLRLQHSTGPAHKVSSVSSRCLALLSTASQLAAFSSTLGLDGSTLSHLFALLLPSLRSRQLKEDTKESILKTYTAIVPCLAQPRRDVMLLGKLLGPAGLGPVGMGPNGRMRQQVLAAFLAVARREEMKDLRPVVQLLERLNALNEDYLEGRNLDVIMPTWLDLAEAEQWSQLMAKTGGSGLALMPLLFHALASLHDEEIVIQVAAAASLKAGIRAAVQGAEAHWLWLLQAGLLPCLRSGLGQASDRTRQVYVGTLAELIHATQASGSWLASHAQTFHGDIAYILRDDIEADFFHNIVHIQLHRQARALQRLGKSLLTPNGQAISTQSLVHVLLPLASQPLLCLDRDVQARTPDPTLLHEANALTALIAERLGWSHYYGLLRRFLTAIGRAEGKSTALGKALVAGLCQILDVFHFPIILPEQVKESPEGPQGCDEVRGIDGIREGEEGSQGIEAENGGQIADQGKLEERRDDQEELEEDNTEGMITQADDTLHPAETMPHTLPAAALNHNTVWRVVMTQLLPSIRALLLKPHKEKDGTRTTMLRAPIALALLKLTRRLPSQFFKEHLTRLLMTVCGTLRNRDSNVRDAAREVLARMAQDLGPPYLGDVLRELKAALREGYTIHVRTFTLHTVLRSLEGVYSPPVGAASFPVPGAGSMEGTGTVERPPLDACLPDIMELITQDLFGEAAKAKEAEAEVKSIKIKEAKGQKSLDALEILARLLLFRPTYAMACPEDPASVSSVHALIKPLLWELHDSESPKVHGRVTQALQRIVGGLTVNQSLKTQEVLLYVYGLVSPFVMAGDDGDGCGETDGSESEDEDRLVVVGKEGRISGDADRGARQRRGIQQGPMVWLPFDSSLKLAVDARLAQRVAIREDARVLDGKNAPKLTGWGRHIGQQVRAQGGVFGSPAALAAGTLGFQLLQSHLKRLGAPSPTLTQLLDPYLTLLSRCLHRHVHDTIALLSLRCLCSLLRQRQRLPSLPVLAPHLLRSTLRLLIGAGGPANARDEVVQTCLKLLTLLLTLHTDHTADDPNSADNRDSKPAVSCLSLPTKSLGSLVSLLRSAALDYDHVNAPFTLFRALVHRRVVVPEMYDLMEQLLAVAVTSRRATVRQMSSQTVTTFLLHYPLTPIKRLTFLHQAIRNLAYAYEDGRVAAMTLLQTLILKLSTSVLDEHAQTIFLAVILRLVNDGSPKPRRMAAEVVATLLKRVSGDVYHVLLEYQLRWLLEEQSNPGLARAAAQAIGFFADARPSLFKRGERALELLQTMTYILAKVDRHGSIQADHETDLDGPKERQGEVVLSWELGYHTLLSLGIMYDCLTNLLESYLSTRPGVQLLCATSELLCYPHAWIRLAASRLMGRYLDRRSLEDRKGSSAVPSSPFLTKQSFQVVRRLCIQLDRPSLDFELAARAVKSLVLLACAYSRRLLKNGDARLPRSETDASAAELMLSERAEAEEEKEAEEEEEEEEGRQRGLRSEAVSERQRDALRWIFHRLACMARRRGEERRCAVFGFFAAFIRVENKDEVIRFLPYMLSPLYRATVDGQNRERVGKEDVLEKAKEVMALLEEEVGSAAYVRELGRIQKMAAEKREGRKKARAVESVVDPEAAAKRKRARQRHKRRREEGPKGMVKRMRSMENGEADSDEGM